MTPLLVAGAGGLALLGLALAARARLARGPAPSSRDVLLAASGTLALAGAVLLGALGGRLAQGDGPEARRALVVLVGLAALGLAAPFVLGRVRVLEDPGRGLDPEPIAPSRAGPLAVLVCGTALHGLFFISLPPLIQIDSYQNLSEPGPLVPTAVPPHHPPLYSELVKLAGGGSAPLEGLRALVLFQHAIALGIALLIERTARRASRSPLAGALAGLVVALDGHLALYAQSVMSEVPAIGLVVLSAALLVEASHRERAAPWVVAAGLAAALATLVRQACEGWFVIGAAWLLLGPVVPRGPALARFLALALLPVAFAALLNHVFAGRLVLTAATGHNLIYRVVQDLPELTDPDASPDDETERARRILWRNRDRIWAGAYRAIHDELGWEDARIDDAVQRFYVEQARRHPARFARVTAGIALEIVLAIESPDATAAFHDETLPRAPASWQALPRAAPVPAAVRLAGELGLTSRALVLLLALAAPLLARGAARRTALLALGSVAYFVGIAALTEVAIPRYRLPGMPFLALAAALAIVGALARKRGPA